MNFFISIFLFVVQANLNQLEYPNNSEENKLFEVIDSMSQDDLVDLLMPSQYGLLYARESFLKYFFGKSKENFINLKILYKTILSNEPDEEAKFNVYKRNFEKFFQ